MNTLAAKLVIVIGVIGFAFWNGKQFGITEQAIVTYRVQAEYDAYRLAQENAVNEIQSKANEQAAIAEMAAASSSAKITKIVTQFVDRPIPASACTLSQPAISTLNQLINLP